MEPGKQKKMLIVVGLVVASFVVAIVLNMTGMKQVHVEAGKPAQQAPAPGGAAAPAGPKP